MTTFDLMLVFAPASITFLFGLGLTPFLTYALYKYKFWKPRAGKVALDGTPATLRNELHAERDVGTPFGGGILITVSVLFTAGLLSFLASLNEGCIWCACVY